MTVEMLRTAAFRKVRLNPFRPALCVAFDNHLVRCVSWAGNRSLATSSLLLVKWSSWPVILPLLSISNGSLFSCFSKVQTVSCKASFSNHLFCTFDGNRVSLLHCASQSRFLRWLSSVSP